MSLPVPPTNVLELLEASDTYAPAITGLRASPRTFLVTGTAGFIGSHLTETLLRAGQRVVGFDSFATGHRRNLDEVLAAVGAEAAGRFSFVEADLRDQEAVRRAAEGVSVVLHHAAFVSVPASLEDPLLAHHVNVTGFLHVLDAARRSEAARSAGGDRGSGPARVVFAASSASYGDDPAPVKVESQLGRVLSPYAASKTADELYAQAFHAGYGLDTVGLRYFNVYGPRQDPKGAYAAVIPAWIETLVRGEPCRIHGDGLTTRDFVHVANVVGANLLAATTEDEQALNRVYNVGCGDSVTLLDLFEAIRGALLVLDPSRDDLRTARPEFGPFRPGDVRHSRADVSLAEQVLGYRAVVGLEEGLAQTARWFAAARSTAS